MAVMQDIYDGIISIWLLIKFGYKSMINLKHIAISRVVLYSLFQHPFYS